MSQAFATALPDLLAFAKVLTLDRRSAEIALRRLLAREPASQATSTLEAYRRLAQLCLRQTLGSPSPAFRGDLLADVDLAAVPITARGALFLIERCGLSPAAAAWVFRDSAERRAA